MITVPAPLSLTLRSRASCGCGWKITFGQGIDPSDVLLKLITHAETHAHSCEMFATITKSPDAVNPLLSQEA